MAFSALRCWTDALRMHAGLKGMPEAVKERIAAESPFDSVADMQMRVNASSKNIRDRLGKAYLPFLHVSAPACLPRGNIRSSGIILGGVGAPIAPTRLPSRHESHGCAMC